MAGMMPALTTGTVTGRDIELAFNGGDDNIGLELGVGLQVGKVSAAIGASGDGDRDHLVNVLGFGPVGGGMVIGPAWGLGGTVLELVIVFAERVSGAFLFPLIVGTPFLEEVAFGTQLLVAEFEFDNFFTEQGALRTGRNGHGNSSEQAEVRRWLKLIKGCVSRCVQSSADE